MKQGYHYNMPMSDYLADPCVAPSLSTSIVSLLAHKTPAHAYLKHPAFGACDDDPNGRADIGSAVHSLIHGGHAVAFCGEVERKGKTAGEKFIPSDWKTDAAKEWRDEAYAAGIIPLLEKDRADVEAAANAAKKTLATLGDGQHEVTMLWQMQNGVWVRGRADMLTSEFDVDTKTCDDADPHAWSKRCIYPNDLDIQAGLRHMGHLALDKPRTMLWLLQEIEPPYANSIVGVGQTMLDLAMRKITHASHLWKKCLETNTWPGYSPLPVWAEAPSFAQFEAEERNLPL